MKKWIKTNFKGGGFISPKKGTIPLAATKRKVPKTIDNHDWTAPMSNQGPHPHCAGFAMAGLIEMWHWWSVGQCKQYDGVKLYFKAKEIEGNNNSGTNFESVIEAAKQLKWIDKDTRYRHVRGIDDIFHAMHKNFGVLLGYKVTQNWNFVSPKTGFIHSKYPEKTGEGHAVLGCAGDRKKYKWIGFQNSWIKNHLMWGWNGFGRMTLTQHMPTLIDAVSVDIPKKFLL